MVPLPRAGDGMEGRRLMAKVPSKDQKVDAGAFNELVAHARLQSLRLIDSKFDMKATALEENRDNWAYKVGDALSDWHLDCESLTLRGQYSYWAGCSDGRRRPVSLKATYLATYKLSQGCEEDPAVAYLRRVGRFSCYPYFRALFSILTEQGGLHLPPLPVISEQPRFVR